MKIPPKRSELAIGGFPTRSFSTWYALSEALTPTPRRRVKPGSFLISSFVSGEERAQAVNNRFQQPANGCSAQANRAHISPTMNDCLVRGSEAQSAGAPQEL